MPARRLATAIVPLPRGFASPGLSRPLSPTPTHPTCNGSCPLIADLPSLVIPFFLRQACKRTWKENGGDSFIESGGGRYSRCFETRDVNQTGHFMGRNWMVAGGKLSARWNSFLWIPVTIARSYIDSISRGDGRDRLGAKKSGRRRRRYEGDRTWINS